jgi:hypothetical protein
VSAVVHPGTEFALTAPIEEHQLDYDWRFSRGSGVQFADYAKPSGNILLVGCPSLASMLGELGCSGQLIERNPNYVSGSENFSVVYADLRFNFPTLRESGRFNLSIVDPPWYPHELLHWTNFGLSQVEVGGSILFTLWPESVRPSARSEHRQVLTAMSKVGQLEHLGNVSYQLPLFERETLDAVDQSPSQREGLLFRLTRENSQLLDVPSFQRSSSEWHRFTLSREQVAVRVSPSDCQTASDDLFEIEPFTLKSTSRRAPILPSINIWTSKNRAARLSRPSLIAEGIATQNEASLSMLVEKMKMSFDPLDVNWGKSWRHPA